MNRHTAAGFILAIMALCPPTVAMAELVLPSAIRVIDGDTIEYKNLNIRLVGFDTPETWKPQCDYELALGQTATNRLIELIGSGTGVDLVMLPGRDRYGRGLARLYVGKQDVSDILVSERLARPYTRGRRAGWCG